jgi:hypothetical protein
VGLFTRKRDRRQEYHTLQVQIARLEGLIAVLENVGGGSSGDDASQNPADVSLSRLRASLTTQQLVSERDELNRLRARADEMLARDPGLAQPAPNQEAPGVRNRLALAIGAIVVIVAVMGIGGLYKAYEASLSQGFVSSSAPDTPLPVIRVLTSTPLQTTATPPVSSPAPMVSPVGVSGRPAGSAAPLYAADWSQGLGGWPATAGWSASDQMLQNDGSDFGDANWIGELWNSHWVAAPYEPEAGTVDYAVEAEIRVLARPSCGSFGFVIRDGYQAGAHLCSMFGRPIAAIRSHTPEQLVVASFDPGNGWHVYRVEARGPALRLLVDGVVVAEARDEAFLAPGRVGLWDDHTPLAVRRFQVLPLELGAAGGIFPR